MSNSTRPPFPPGSTREEIRACFLRETAHLGPEGQRRVLEAMRAAWQSRKSRMEAQTAIEKARRAISELEFTERQARAYLSRHIELIPVDRAGGPIYWKYPGKSSDYQLFGVSDPARGFHVGASRYLMVHKVTGEVHDLGVLGERAWEWRPER